MVGLKVDLGHNLMDAFPELNTDYGRIERQKEVYDCNNKRNVKHGLW